MRGHKQGTNRLGPADRQWAVPAQVMSIILATDMGRHNEYVAKLKLLTVMHTLVHTRTHTTTSTFLKLLTVTHALAHTYIHRERT